MYLLLRLIINALAVILVSRIVPGVTVTSFGSAFVAAIVIGLVNALIRPVFAFLSFPITVITLGLFTLVINALMFWLASAFVPGFQVASFGAAFFGAIVFWLVSWVTNGLISDNRRP